MILVGFTGPDRGSLGGTGGLAQLVLGPALLVEVVAAGEQREQVAEASGGQGRARRVVRGALCSATRRLLCTNV